jgi:stage V sporulation protein B
VGFVKIFSLSLFSQAFVLLAGFVNSIIITRQLNLDGRGQYALTMGIITIFSLIFGDGLYRSNTYMVSLNRKSLSRLISNSIVAIGIFGLILLAISIFIKGPMLEKVLPGVDFSLVLIAIISVVPVIFVRSFTGLFLGLQYYKFFNALVVLPIVLYSLLNVTLFWHSGFTPYHILMNYLIAMVVFTAASFFSVVRFEPFRFQTDWNLGKKSMSAGLKSVASNISLFLLFRVDIFLINFFLGTDQAGLYSIAVLLSELLQKLANTSGTVIFPKIAGERRIEKGRRLSFRVVLFVLVVGIGFSGVLYLFGEKIIVLLYTERFALAARPLYWLLPGTVIMAMGKIFLFSLWGRGFPKITLIVPLFAFFLNIVLNLLLIPRLGLAGAAISTSFSYIVFGLSLGIYFLFHDERGTGKAISEIEEFGAVN